MIHGPKIITQAIFSGALYPNERTVPEAVTLKLKKGGATLTLTSSL
jgi:hypothetical protein